MPRRTEPLNRGLVTVRDAALLAPGELSNLRNAVYMPGDGAIWRATGRVTAGTATADPSGVDVSGLRDIQFDNGTHLVIAHASSNYASAALSDSMGTFGLMASGVGVGSQLEVVHYRNRYFLFNGTGGSPTATAGLNRVVYLSATSAATNPTVRQHGMLEVSGQPATTSTTGTFSQSVTGYYEYWTTEVARITQDGAVFDLESTFSGNPATVYVTATGMVPVIYQPPIANVPLATHWRVYRSPKKDKESDKKFPTGFMIGEMGTGTSTANAIFYDTFTASTASSFPLSVNSGGDLLADFGDAATLSADNNVYASAALSGANRKLQGCYGFNLGGFAGNVRGITITAEASATTSPVTLEFRIGRNRQADGGFIPPAVSGAPAQFRNAIIDSYLKLNTVAKSVTLTATANPGTTITLGGPTDRWFPQDQIGFTDSDFNGNFMVQILAQAPASTTPTVAIDYLKLGVYYAGSTDSVIQFPTVAYTFGDVSAQVGKNGKPPTASTGTLFQDALVTNDISNPAVIRYSYPGDPEAFPSTYYLDFETAHNDRVTSIKLVNSRLIVMLRNSVYRVNYLPSERDASFDRGKAIEIVSNDYGCVNEMCSCTFTIDGMQERLAFVSDTGIYVTDGYTVSCWTDDLDWRGDRTAFGVANLSASYLPVALVNDPENQHISFLFRNTILGGATSPGGGDYWKINLQYSDMRNGKPRISGLVTMLNSVASTLARPTSMWPIVRASGNVEVFYGYGASGAGSTAAGAGQVWRETGNTIPSGYPAMLFTTRKMFLAGLGKEWRLNELYGYVGFQNIPASTTINYTARRFKTNTATVINDTKSHTIVGVEPMHKVIFNRTGEAIRIQAEVTGTCGWAQDNITIDGEDFGLEDAGT